METFLPCHPRDGDAARSRADRHAKDKPWQAALIGADTML